MNKNYIYDLATDIANLPLMPSSSRIRFRALIFRLIAEAIELAKTDPSILETLKNWAEVQD